MTLIYSAYVQQLLHICLLKPFLNVKMRLGLWLWNIHVWLAGTSSSFVCLLCFWILAVVYFCARACGRVCGRACGRACIFRMRKGRLFCFCLSSLVFYSLIPNKYVTLIYFSYVLLYVCSCMAICLWLSMKWRENQRENINCISYYNTQAFSWKKREHVD